jgi:membrane protease subunit (stomatin/prohibitin family)
MGAIGDMDSYMKFKAARAMGDAANNPGGGGTGEGVGVGAGMGMGMGMAGMIANAFQGQQQPAAQQPAPQQQPAAQQPAASGPMGRAQIQQAIEALDMRFSMGEISEEAYNRMLKRWEERLQQLGD